MSIERPERGETFLSRWSRVKSEARDEAAAPENAGAVAPPAKAEPEAEPPPLPPVEELTLESDFTGFFHPKVEEDVRRAALRKLFSDPHFNVMDGLDVYIDDYSKSEPIPPAMLASLKHAQRIFEWASEKKDDAQTADASAAAATEPAAIAPPAVSADDAARLDPAPESAPELSPRKT